MIKRPQVSDEIILAAANKIAAELECDAEQIAEVYCYGMDGFELGKELDRIGWDICAQDVETLDCMGYQVGVEHEAVCKKWFKDNDIQPPLPIGTNITKGVINGICEYSAGRYLVKENGCTEDGRHLLVKFEDAVAV
jgi:hypothetical protein